MDAIYSLEVPSQGGVKIDLNSSPHGVGSIDRLINRIDSRMNKMAMSQIKSNSGRDSRGLSRPHKSSKHSQLPRQVFSRNQNNSKESNNTNQRNKTGFSSSAFHKNLIPCLLEDLSLIHVAHQASTDALILIKKLFTVSATVKGILKKLSQLWVMWI